VRRIAHYTLNALTVLSLLLCLPHRKITYASLTVLSITVPLACLVFATIYSRHGLGSEAYILPLVREVAVYRENLIEPHLRTWGPMQLVEVHNPDLSSYDLLAADLRRVAVVNSFVVGETAKGFFIIDASSPQFDAVKMIVSREAWQQALVVAGLPPEVQLSEPDALARGLPNRVLRRSQMRVMRGALSLTDQEWEGVLIGGSWLFMFLLGTFAARRVVTPVGVLAGMFTIGFARLFLGEGGPDFIGGVFDPFVSVGIGHLGRLLGNTVRASRRPAEPVAM
jgi:hypothetical protein